jgi:hypothetical protein
MGKYLLMMMMIFVSVMLVIPAIAEAKPEQPTQQKVFNSAEEAVDALITACKNNDTDMLLDLMGHNYAGIVNPSDGKMAKLHRETFYKMAIENRQLETFKEGVVNLIVGNIEYPFPIPIIKDKDGWRFDTATGLEEIVSRRIGENELAVIAVCRVYVKAQREYIEKDRDGDKVAEYAQKLISEGNKKDGLYWDIEKHPDGELSPLGPMVAAAQDHLSGNKNAKNSPFFGYYFKILTKQGENAPGGKYDYIVNGNMIGGFALAAYPADYGVSGIMTFIINQQGVLYQKDLGENTLDQVKKMDEYNPDNTWSVVTD